ncbi:hypothetical protein HDU98_001742, partial [Podochytrium sp. JEL0797]
PYQDKDVSPRRPTSRDTRDRRGDRDRRDDRGSNREQSGYRGNDSRRQLSPGDRPVPKPSKTLGVFGLSILTHERDVENLFRPFGKIMSISVLKDKIVSSLFLFFFGWVVCLDGFLMRFPIQTGKSRGYGFVTFDEIESATKAIAGMNGVVYNERQMRVDYTLSTKQVESSAP